MYTNKIKLRHCLQIFFFKKNNILKNLDKEPLEENLFRKPRNGEKRKRKRKEENFRTTQRRKHKEIKFSFHINNDSCI